MILRTIDGLQPPLNLTDLSKYLTWLKHPLFDETTKFLGDSAVRLEIFLKGFDHLLESCRGLWQEIYKDSVSVVPPFVKLDEPGNNFVPYVYLDAVGFALGDSIDPVHQRYYNCVPFSTSFQVNIPSLGTIASFEGEYGGIGICEQIRDAHMQLRQEYRLFPKVSDFVQIMYELEAQREAFQGEVQTIVEILRSIPA